MGLTHRLFAACIALGALAEPARAENDPDKCIARLEEIDVAIQEARKEGSMRKVATLKDLRAEVSRCASKKKTE